MSRGRGVALAFAVAALLLLGLVLLAPEAEAPRPGAVVDVPPSAPAAPTMSAVATAVDLLDPEGVAPLASEAPAPLRRRRTATLEVLVERGSPPAPAPGASIVVKHQQGEQEVVTDARGQARLELPGYVDATLFARTQDEVTATARVQLRDEERSSLALRLLPTRQEIVALVVDATGAPIPTAWIEVEGAGPVRRVLADARGRIVVDRLPALDLDLRVGAPGFRTARHGGVPLAAPTAEWTVDLVRVARLEGRLLVDGRPLPPGPELPDLLVDSERLQADADGRFVVEVMGGGWQANVSACVRRGGRLLFGAATVTPGDAETVRLDVELVGTGVVRGRVLRGGQPFDGLQVQLLNRSFPFGTARVVRIGRDGEFRLVDAPPGKARLQVGAASFAPAADVEVDVRPGETTVVELSLESTGDLSGVLTRDGAPVARERVWFTREGQQGGCRDTDEAGRFLARGLLPGRWTLSTRSARGLAQVTVALAAGQALEDVRVELGPPARLAARVVDPDGSPVTPTRVRLTGPDGVDVWWGDTDADGAFGVDWHPGRFVVSLAEEDALDRVALQRGVRATRCDPVTIDLRDGETTEAVLRVVDQP